MTVYLLLYNTIGHTTAIIDAEANITPARIKIISAVFDSSSKNTIVAKRKNVSIAMTIETFRRVEMTPKNGSFSFFVFKITYSSTILLHFLTNPLNSNLVMYPSSQPLLMIYWLVLNPKVFSKQGMMIFLSLLSGTNSIANISFNLSVLRRSYLRIYSLIFCEWLVPGLYIEKLWFLMFFLTTKSWSKFRNVIECSIYIFCYV